MDNALPSPRLPRYVPIVVWLTAVIFIGTVLGNLLWLCAADVLAFNRTDQTISFAVTEEDDLSSIAAKLSQHGLVNFPGLFKLFAKLTRAADRIQPGTYNLNTLYDYPALVDALSTSQRKTINVTIPEGATLQQIFRLLEEKGVCSAEELENAAAEDWSSYSFLEGISTGLEGYLFPDTYTFYVGDSPRRVIGKMLSTFENRFPLNEDALTTLGNNLSVLSKKTQGAPLTLHTIVTIASMIEKESAGSAESPVIASVIYNRLANSDAYPYLNIDATLIYATGNSNITDADKKVDSPYNTYRYPGLIPGPICSPSLSSLQAALNPEFTDYYFYALNPSTKTHHFTKTYAEHLAFLESIEE